MPDHNKITWCRCSICIGGSSNGKKQTKQTARNHQDDDDERAGKPRGHTRRLKSLLPSIPTLIPSHHPIEMNVPAPIPDPNTTQCHDSELEYDPLADTHDGGDSSGESENGVFTVQIDETQVDKIIGELFDNAPSLRNDLSDSDSDIDHPLPFASILDGNYTSDSSDDSDCTTSENEFPAKGIPLNITDDPLFISRASLFDTSEASDSDDDDPDRDLPAAFDEHFAIRSAYIRVFVSCAFEGTTHAAAKIMLDGTYHNLLALQATTPGFNIPGLSNMARTIQTVEKRLGVSTDKFITYLFVCTKCWKLHYPHQLSELTSPNCTAEDCEGSIYTVKRTADGKEKRTPCKIIPYVDPERIVARILLQPGKFEQLNEWRGPDDTPGERPPSHLRGYEAFEGRLDEPMQDIYDAWGWRAMQAGLERRRTGKWSVKDIDVHELHQQFVALPCGLCWQINVDWFQSVKGTTHSTGAVYMVLCNNLRGIRYLREETHLVLMISGPKEPSLEELNQLLIPFVGSMARLYNGREFKVYGQKAPMLSHSILYNHISDLLASRKVCGLPSHTSKRFMCPQCEATFPEINDHQCYDPAEFVMRDDLRYLKYAFRAREAEPEVAEDIFNKRGVRWSELDLLPTWMPRGTSLIDFMHCVYLTMVKHVTKNILYNYGMFNGGGEGREDRADPLQEIEDIFSTMIWPPSISRLPPSITRGAGSVKADQWRSHITVLFVALYAAWQVDGTIPDTTAPPSPPKTKIARAQAASEKLVRARMKEAFMMKNADTMSPDDLDNELERIGTVTMDRSLQRHYDTLLEFTASVRILSSEELSPNDVKRGCSALSECVQTWAHMGCHLTPYFHFAMHLEPQFLQFGPCCNWWVYAYERNNGFLGRFNHNGHAGGEMEGTMMRGWWKTAFIQDLITHLENLENPTSADKASLELLMSYIKGGTKERRGTLENYLARMQIEGTLNNRRFASFPHDLELRGLGTGYYGLVFEYLKRLWRISVTLYSDTAIDIPDDGASFTGRVSSYTHIWIKNLRYGASTSQRGVSGQYGYIENRSPVRILYIFRATQSLRNGEPLVADFAIVQRFRTSDMMPEFPWAMRALDLGVGAWHAETFYPREVVSLVWFAGQFVLIPISVQEKNLWITVAHHHASPEIDESLLDNDDYELNL